MPLPLKHIGFLFLLGLGTLSYSFAQTIEQPLLQVLDGAKGQLKKDSSIQVSDSTWWTPSQKLKLDMSGIYRVKNIISLKIKEDTAAYIKPFTAIVKIRLFITNSAATIDTTQTQTLVINYDTITGITYNNQRTLVFYNAYTLKAKIISVDTIYAAPYTGSKPAVTQFIRLENEMQITREYNLSCIAAASLPVTVSASNLATNGELDVAWGYIQGATEYDLEWVYLDNESVADPELYKTGAAYDPKKIFTDNATRVTISSTSYSIPMLYPDQGVLFCRFRPVQNKPNGQRFEGSWSSDNASGVGQYIGFAGHETYLNWQSNTSFAEEGKRKSVVQYYDGTLRSRQTVTKDNTLNTTVVAETMYDYQGRPVIQVLPAPTLNTIIAYSRNFNQAISNIPYDKSLYDTMYNSANYCLNPAPPLDSNYGASKYYSANNPLKTSPVHLYIPNAFNYPFTEIRYVQDNTARILAQSGVGWKHKIGSGHETKYFYATPDQKDLDGLFGTEVGYAAHYTKNMVRDANGQYSVSYIDMHGRTVATALAGKAPAGMDTIPSYRKRTVTEKLADSSNNISTGLVMESSRSILVADSGAYTFKYNLNADSINIKACSNATICYDCLYNLEITITDECNNCHLPSQQSYIRTKSNFTFPAIDTLCNAPAALVDSFVIGLPEGNYTITKKLSISKYGMDYYRDSVFTKKNTCRTFNDFYKQVSDTIRAGMDCGETSCDSCTARNLTRASFTAYYLKNSGISLSDSVQYMDDITLAYKQSIEECSYLCGTAGQNTFIRNAMLLDMTAPVGQYANPDSSIIPSNRRFNIFDIDNQIWKTTIYHDEYGKPDSAINDNGLLVPVNQLSRQQFLLSFKETWALDLLPNHPEYKKLIEYEKHVLSHQWDERFGSVQIYAEAKTKGYLNPTGNSGIHLPSQFAGLAVADPDPLAKTDSLLLLMTSKIFNGSDINTALSMWGAACITAKCPGIANCTNAYSNANLNNCFNESVFCTGELDMAWLSFRQQYINEKRVQLMKILNSMYPTVIPPYRVEYFAVAAPATFTNSYEGQNQAAISANVGTQVNQLYQNNCAAYANSWWANLAPCFLKTDPLQRKADSLRLIPAMIEICRQGSDPAHPWGASSTAPGNTLKFKSFEELVKFYIDSMKVINPSVYNYDYSCNADLIYYPQPYDTKSSLASEYIFTRPDTCQCSRITSLYGQYKQYGYTDADFGSYIQRVLGTTISNADITKLLNMCTGQDSCRFLSAPIILPPALQCGIRDVCATCTQVQNAFNLYKIKYPGQSPSYSGDDSIQSLINTAFANSMNHTLGFSKQSSDYLIFMDSCALRYSADGTRCDTLNTTIANFKTFYQSINFAQIYQNRRITKCAETVILDAANALINANNNVALQSLNIQGYARAPYSNLFNEKLKSVAPNATSYFDPANTFNSAIAPLRLDCSLLPYSTATGNFTEYNKLVTNYVFPLEYISGAASKNELGINPVFGTVVEDHNQYLKLMWADSTSTFDYDAYGAPTPLAKYIFHANSPLEAHVYGAAFIDAPANITTLAQYNSYYDNYFTNYNVTKYDAAHNAYVYPAGIELNKVKKVSNLRFATNLLSQTTLSAADISSKYLVCSLDYNDGSKGNAYFYVNGGSQIAYKETIDTNLYNQNCQKAFTKFYNNQFATNYTYNQIDSIYFARCGYHPSPCANTGPTNCDTLRKAVEDYNANVYNIQKDPVDSSETNVFDLFQGYYPPFSNLNNYKVKNYINNGTTAKMPDSLKSIPGATAFNYVIANTMPMCTGPDITFEFRVKVDTGQQNAAVRNGIGPSELVAELFFDGGSTVIGPVFNSLYPNYAGYRRPVNTWGDPNFIWKFSDWTVIKIIVKGNTASTYRDDILVGTINFPGRSPRTRLDKYQFGMLTASYYVDWVKIYDGLGVLKYQEDFNDIKNFTKPPAEWVCANTSCQSNFTGYFNTRFGTSLSYSQITKLYQQNCGINMAPCGTNEFTLCGKTEPFFPVLPAAVYHPCEDSASLSFVRATELYNAYTDSLKNSFDSVYYNKCKNAFKKESFTVTHPVSEYHYTLYYYNQAGNLVKTVPPSGVDLVPSARASWLDSVGAARKAGMVLVPAHGLNTNYRYNTLNGVVAQKTPDAGNSNFWYDRLGRLVVSQNAKQRTASVIEQNRQYSYTIYDQLGRIKEVGQLANFTTTPLTQAVSSDDLLFSTWFNSATHSNINIAQVTRTSYDNKYPALNTLFGFEAKNLRNRVAYTTYTDDNNAASYNSATFYSYDIHGNVDTLVNDYGNNMGSNTANVMNSNNNRWKRIVYQYDLISGKVNHVAYQPQYTDGSGVLVRPQDAFYHRYSYDAENRLTLVKTSADSTVWEKDARYSYYRHGPLARTVLGQQTVQGVDYAYTLQGWLKGVNGTTLSLVVDMGRDGEPSNPPTKYIAKDVMSFSLNYFDSDYVPIGASRQFAPVNTSTFAAGTYSYRPLFNGNISSMCVNIQRFNSPAGAAGDSGLLYNYKYDQLNRLVAMDAFRGLNTGINQWNTNMNSLAQYQERVAYDANGNILKYLRNGNQASLNSRMDSIAYNYNAGTNQLNWVKDSVPATRYAGDIDNNQLTGNYSYDAIGNLISDNSEGIKSIAWNVYGKITAINKADSSGSINNKGRVRQIIYTYDASGNRISKRVSKYTNAVADFTWYVRDASGNVLSTYGYSGDSTGAAGLSSQDLTQNEIYLYGSSRLGSLTINRNAEISLQVPDTAYSFPLVGIAIKQPFKRGIKQYELSNHLGNVLVTISDKKLQHTVNNTAVDYYNADVVTANDYYPGGMLMPGRKFAQASTNYRYHFNGKENDNEVKGEGNQQDYGMRIYDTRLGRFLSVDPITKNYPELTPYQFASNSPITGIDIDGLEFYQSNDGKIYRNQMDFLLKKGPVDPQTQAAVQVGMAMLNSRATATPPTKTHFPIASVPVHSEAPLVKFIVSIAPTYQSAIIRQWCRECETKQEIDQEKEKIKRNNYELGQDENGNDFAITKLEKNNHFNRFSEKIAIPLIFGAATEGILGSFFSNAKRILNPNEIYFMQNSIKNTTGEFTVLGNANALKSGELNPEILRMNVWNDANGKIWTLDHRKLAAFRLSGLQEAPVQWTNPSGQMWKMTTTNGGTSIKLKLGDGKSMIVK